MTSNDFRSSDFSYKKYSLEQLDNWIHDAITCEDLTAQDIYDTVVKCAEDVVKYHKKELSKSTELLSLLKGHRSFKGIFEIDTSLDGIDASKKPGISSATETDWNDFWEEYYYPEEYHQSSLFPLAKKKWTLPVEEVRDEDTGEDEYCITFPDDLLEAANLKEGDTIEWVDRGDGSYEMRKVTQPLQMDEC